MNRKMSPKTTIGGMQVFLHNDWTFYDNTMNQIRQIVELWQFENDGKYHGGLESVKQIIQVLKALPPKSKKQIGIQ